jgi:hypothetical protein
MNSKIRSAIRLAQAAALAICAALAVQAADSPTPTPTRTPRPSGGNSLNEVAKEKELKGAEKGKSIVISNENLSSYAEKGSVTAVDEGKKKQPNRRPVRDTTKVEVQPPSDPAHTDERRRYWQGLYKRQIDLIASIRNQITILDETIPGLWRDFYAWDDPMYRDGVIKPKLDEATARRTRLEQRLIDAEARMSEIKEDARKDGAEPGWFRGIKLPTPMPSTPTPQVVVAEP